MRMISRAMLVTMTGPSPEPMPRCFSPKFRNGHPCLGDMMEESITWMDVDSEDDQHSPKQSDQHQNVPEDHGGAGEGDGCVHLAMQAIVCQQRAPGIVVGMPKCLS